MVLTKKKKRTILFALYIYMILGSILVWLAFFSSGLEIVEKTSFEQQGTALFFKNTSNRVISNISVSVLQEGGQKTLLMNISKVLPGQEVEIDIAPLADFQEAVLVAEAPFHTPFIKLFVLAGGKKGLNYNLEFPSLIFLGNTFRFEINACNELSRVRKVGIQTIVEQAFFEGQGEFERITVPPKGCKSIEYSLTPIQAGQTTIFFNIEVENNKERISKTLEIVE